MIWLPQYSQMEDVSSAHHCPTKLIKFQDIDIQVSAFSRGVFPLKIVAVDLITEEDSQDPRFGGMHLRCLELRIEQHFRCKWRRRGTVSGQPPALHGERGAGKRKAPPRSSRRGPHQGTINLGTAEIDEKNDFRWLVSEAAQKKKMDSFSTKNLAMQAQKKLLSKMASKSVASVFIDDTSSEILDELYRVTKEYTRNRKEAQKIIKNLIKVIMKLAVLYRNGQFNGDEHLIMQRFRKKVHTLAMTAVSFYQIDFTFDRRVMSNILNECRDMLHQAVNRHLTAKSHSRINHVFNHFADYEFLSALYGPSEPYRTHLKKICEGINKMLDEGNI
ncbi:hypothetical protein NDU88_005415 [Pleurodeles waltl]|uniref:Tumor necrosis factor alpha-induced protein 8-like protein 1 n=1 Tax=Pleurodeles waltl TaxID=8319 RepID=A0AAV7L2L6_PLEWA|nr:hypothetical protein NDU88_005415 [Pleurodeles waltl]